MGAPSGPRMYSKHATVAIVLLLVAAAMPVSAEHAQEFGEGEIVFDHRTGNEWWVEVDVDRSVEEVFARHSGSQKWHGLTLRDWGAWAGSFHVPEGEQVQFRAGAGDAEATSCWFTHPEGREECQGGDFDPSFDTPGGNEWWVEVYVEAQEPISGVDARADEGPWRALDLRDWGAWAESFHVPEGSIVEFRAHAASGESAVSGGYRWTSGEPVEDEAPSFDVAFGSKSGNAWWVETFAISEDTVVAVDARADEGPWHAMELRDWGAWAKSFHAPEGSVVEFRAHNEEGEATVSDGFLWPSGAPVDEPDGDWPREGSYLRYDAFAADSNTKMDATLTLVHHEGSWSMKCEGSRETDGQRETIDAFEQTDAPLVATSVEKGDLVEVPTLSVCREGEEYEVEVEDVHTFTTHHEGDPVTIDTWYAERVDPCKCLRWEAQWDQEVGVVVSWERNGRGGVGGTMNDTDAPIV